MNMEQRTSVIPSYYFKTTVKFNGMINEEKTKSFSVTKRMVYESYLKVNAKNGSAGIDGQTIEYFNSNLSSNLYKIWNRMASGSYMPPTVQTVYIPKKQGGLRPLGIPTVGDRIAQCTVKDHLEPTFEKIFHSSSFGYRPARSAHDALRQCYHNCLKYSWVIDLDIKGFFDNICHEKLIKMLKRHKIDKWALLYINRWLKAGVQQVDGSIINREKGTPQGGVISPLLANLYLHYVLDSWMESSYNQNPFERYADDIVIHCKTKEKAAEILENLKVQMSMYGLTLHPLKTKIVYCVNYLRTEKHIDVENSFTFLSYNFGPRTAFKKNSKTELCILFNCAISNEAKVAIRTSLVDIINPKDNTTSIDVLAERLNPKIRGWINYYGLFYKKKLIYWFACLDSILLKWIKSKYRIKSFRKCFKVLNNIKQSTPFLFYHWKLAILKTE